MKRIRFTIKMNSLRLWFKLNKFEGIAGLAIIGMTVLCILIPIVMK